MGKCVVHPIQPDRNMAGTVGEIKVSVSDLEAQSGGRWLPCDGRLIDQTAYPELYAAAEVRFQSEPAGFPDDIPSPGPPRFGMNLDGAIVNHRLIQFTKWRLGNLGWAEDETLGYSRLVRRESSGNWVTVGDVSVQRSVYKARIYPLSEDVVLAVAGNGSSNWIRGDSFLTVNGGVTWKQLNCEHYLVAPRLVEQGGERYILAGGVRKTSSSSSGSDICVVRVRLRDMAVTLGTLNTSGVVNIASLPGRSRTVYHNGEFLCMIGGWSCVGYGRLENGVLIDCAYQDFSNPREIAVFQGQFILATSKYYRVFPLPSGSWGSNLSTSTFDSAAALIPYQGKLLLLRSGSAHLLDQVDVNGVRFAGPEFTFEGFGLSPETGGYHYSDIEQMGLPYVVNKIIYNDYYLSCKWRQVPLEMGAVDGRNTYILAR